MQQGRLIVDADWNEQSAIILNHIRNLAADLIGWHGGVEVSVNEGMLIGPLAVTIDNNMAYILEGRYYIDGIAYDWHQPDTKAIDIEINESTDAGQNNALLLYADIYERLIVSAEDSNFLDPGLMGLDTMARQKVAGKIDSKLVVISHNVVNGGESSSTVNGTTAQSIRLEKREFLNVIEKSRLLPELRAFTRREQTDDESCESSANTGFVGLENQLYRVEVHGTGLLLPEGWQTTEPPTETNYVTFKWSRDNGSIVYSGTLKNTTIELKSKWRDDSKAIKEGNYVEVIEKGNDSGILVEVINVLDVNGKISFTFEANETIPETNNKEVIVRRWDHQRSDATPISPIDFGFMVRQSGTSAADTLSVEFPLEDGIFVQLKRGKDAKFETGDHWLIPARTATGDVLWKRDNKGEYDFAPPRIIEHHYAPIAVIYRAPTDTSAPAPTDGTGAGTPPATEAPTDSSYRVIDLRRNIKQSD